MCYGANPDTSLGPNTTHLASSPAVPANSHETLVRSLSLCLSFLS